MGIRKRPFEWLFPILKFLTLKDGGRRVWGFFNTQIRQLRKVVFLFPDMFVFRLHEHKILIL